MPDDGVRFPATLETVDSDGFPSVVEEDFALHVAVEHGVFVFDMVGIEADAAFHVVAASQTFECVVASQAVEAVVFTTSGQFSLIIVLIGAEGDMLLHRFGHIFVVDVEL